MASTRLLVRPSWRKKTRCPTPQSGVVRNSSGPAPPCVMPSARPFPMRWTRRSEKRFAVWLESAALGLVEDPLAIILPVVNEGVWQLVIQLGHGKEAHENASYRKLVCNANAGRREGGSVDRPVGKVARGGRT